MAAQWRKRVAPKLPGAGWGGFYAYDVAVASYLTELSTSIFLVIWFWLVSYPPATLWRKSPSKSGSFPKANSGVAGARLQGKSFLCNLADLDAAWGWSRYQTSRGHYQTYQPCGGGNDNSLKVPLKSLAGDGFRFWWYCSIESEGRQDSCRKNERHIFWSHYCT